MKLKLKHQRMARLKPKLSLIVTLALAFLIFCSQIMISPQEVLAAQAKVVLSGVKGDVLVKKGGGLRELPALDGMELVQGDWLRTGKTGTVKLSFEDGTEAMVGSNSSLNIQRLSKTDLSKVASRSEVPVNVSQSGHQSSVKLKSGSIWSKVKSLMNLDDSYEVETPTAVMGVRGTLYLVSVDPGDGSTQGDVIDGVVGVTQNQEATQAAPIQLVTMGRTLRLVSSTEPLPNQQVISSEDLIKTTQSEILVQLVNDIMERTKELAVLTKEQQQAFGQTGKLDDIKGAIGTSFKLEELASFGKEFMTSLQTSDKLEEIKQVLSDNNQSLEQVQSTIDTLSTETEQLRTDVVETAKEAGVSQEQIDNIGKEAVGVPVSSGTGTPPQEQAPPPPAPPAEQAPSGGNRDSDSSDDSSNTTAPLVLTGTTLPLGTVGVNYSTSITATGGVGPYSYAVISGTTPGGITLDAAGILSGSATTPGAFTFTVEVKDSVNTTASAEFALTISAASSTAASIASTNPTAFTEGVGNVGSLTSNEIVITIVNGALAEDIGRADVTPANLPAGMDIDVVRINETKLTLYIVGRATNHANVNDVANLTFTIAQAKVTGATANLTTENISIDFADPADASTDDISSSFNDPNFKHAVWEWLGNSGAVGAFSKQDLSNRMAAKDNNLDVSGRNISSLDGLENFGGTGLTALDCSDNQLSSLPTLPTSLTTLSCNWNYLNVFDGPLKTSLDDCSAGTKVFTPQYRYSFTGDDPIILEMATAHTLELTRQQSYDGINWNYVSDGVISKFTFTSSNAAVATVDSFGVITAHALGSCDIYAKYDDVDSDFTKVVIPVTIAGDDFLGVEARFEPVCRPDVVHADKRYREFKLMHGDTVVDLSSQEGKSLTVSYEGGEAQPLPLNSGSVGYYLESQTSLSKKGRRSVTIL